MEKTKHLERTSWSSLFKREMITLTKFKRGKGNKENGKTFF